MPQYDHLTKDELIRLLETRDSRDASRFGLVWETNEIEIKANSDSRFLVMEIPMEQ